jgi:hypothetical protein
MRNRNVLVVLMLAMAGCWHPPHPQVEDVKTDPAKPVIVVEKDIDSQFDPVKQSQALARLAARQAASASVHDGTRRLSGVLNELVADGVPQSYVDSIRAAVPAIKPPTKDDPARNLTPDEIQKLRGVR